MRYTRNHYHDLIKKIKSDRNSAVKRSLGSALQSGQNRNFWSELSKISKAKGKKVSVDVNDLHTDVDIANSFATQYETLYNSVVSDPSSLFSIYNDIITGINTTCVSDSQSCRTFNDHIISYDNVLNAVKSLHLGKADGVDPISSDNLKHASRLFVQYVMYLFNSIMSHGCIPKSFLFATVLPLPKSPRLDLKNSGNYRAIALSSVLGKVFDKIIIDKQSAQLSTSDLQFGYKRNSSTVMCTTMLSETIEYYVSNNSHAFVLYIDASKAFDRVCHSKLFDVLQAQGMCPLILRALFNMYTHSEMKVRWESETSKSFSLQNGVKQGGCLSPMLFTVYFDILIKRLEYLGIGCHIGRRYCGVFGYADDLALVCPTLYGLKQMIAVCEEFASEFNIMFNPKKSKLMCFNVSLETKPVIKLCNQLVDVVDSEVYLGTKIFTNVYEKPIDELVCDFQRRSNHIVHNFKMCDSQTLCHIFSSHCESFYGCELCNYSMSYMSKLYVSWRKIIRHIYRLSPKTHNYIVSNIGNCIIVRLDRRLCKFIFNLMHNENSVVRQVTTYKLLCPRSTIADNYKYLCCKYRIAHADWHNNVNFLMKKICVEYTNHDYSVCNTVRELCDIRDGVKQCDYFDNDEISILLTSLCTD